MWSSAASLQSSFGGQGSYTVRTLFAQIFAWVPKSAITGRSLTSNRFGGAGGSLAGGRLAGGSLAGGSLARRDGVDCPTRP